MLAVGRIARSLTLFWQRGRSVERASYVVGALLLVSGLIHLAILSIGGGAWEGPLSLWKAAPLGVSLCVGLLYLLLEASFPRGAERGLAIFFGLFISSAGRRNSLCSLPTGRGG